MPTFINPQELDKDARTQFFTKLHSAAPPGTYIKHKLPDGENTLHDRVTRWENSMPGSFCKCDPDLELQENGDLLIRHKPLK